MAKSDSMSDYESGNDVDDVYDFDEDYDVSGCRTCSVCIKTDDAIF